MRVAVLAAGGRTGRLVVAECERRGHEVVAFTRRSELIAAFTGTRVVRGDVSDAAVLRDGLAGVDAVISTLPGGDRHDPTLAERTTAAVVAAMSEAGVLRLIVTSAYPLVAAHPRVLLRLLRLILRVSYADVARMERLVMASELEWTIVRLNRLTDDPPSGRVEARETLLPRAASLSRADVAAFLVDRAEHPGGRLALNVTGVP